ncbi:uncharacterized protein LOC118280428 isoform X1 [Spodoptera frugiperda]|uniref:Uncharacterized protein LOC118280428 isoform X1 n=1 Tax=Spodoptera frugiperda TaxID=7108 RepID=A0A9R0E257_SPOFR|nr:uncharacterized protein LOC118280428 isoform X1 [Spodoptera frugiperda]
MTMLAYVVASYMSMQLAGVAGYPYYYVLPHQFTYNQGNNLNINIVPINVPYHSDNATVKLYINGLYRHCTNLKELIDFKTYQLTDSYTDIDMYINYHSTTICMYNLVKGSASKNYNFWYTPQNYSYEYTLLVDFQKLCDAKLECKITESSKYVCTFNTKLTNLLYYTIHQMYSTTNKTIGRSIGAIYYPPTTVFTIKIERFDFNSTIVARLKKYKDDNEDFLHDLKIAERDIVKDQNYAIMSYSDTERVIFSCAQYISQYPSVGLIDSSGYNIETVEGTTYNELLDVGKNGSMLCCIYYEVTNLYGTRYITRVIANKTLLLYNKTEFNNHKTTDNDTSYGTLEQNIISNALKLINYLYLLIPVAVLLSILITTYIYIRRKRLKAETAPESINENQEINYVTLDLKSSGMKAPRPDEPQYAQIMTTSKF